MTGYHFAAWALVWITAAFFAGFVYARLRHAFRQNRFLQHPGAVYSDALFMAYHRERRMMAAARSTLDEYAEPYGEASTYRFGERNG